MSTSRQRMLDAFLFQNPDKIPVVYHSSPAGLLVHGQKLLDLFYILGVRSELRPGKAVVTSGGGSRRSSR